MSGRTLVIGALMLVAGPAFAQKGAVLPGASSKDPVSIDAGKLDYFDQDQKLVYSGAVVATQGESRLKASVLTIFLEPAPANSNSHQMRRMEAQGPVTITAKDQIGTGDSGIYDKTENKVFLTGHVTLSQGPNVTKGERLTYDLNTNQAVVVGGSTAQGGRVRSIFTPGEKSASPLAGGEGRGQAPEKTRGTRAEATAPAQ